LKRATLSFSQSIINNQTTQLESLQEKENQNW